MLWVFQCLSNCLSSLLLCNKLRLNSPRVRSLGVAPQGSAGSGSCGMLQSQCRLAHRAGGSWLQSLTMWALHRAAHDVVACFPGTRDLRQKEHDQAHVSFIACLESDMPSLPLDAMAHTAQPRVAATTRRCAYREGSEKSSHTRHPKSLGLFVPEGSR